MATSGDLRVVSSRFPYLPLHVRIRDLQHDVEALLDTGFDGALLLPGGAMPELGEPDDYFRWILADGSRIWAPVYLGTVAVGRNQPMPIYVTVLGNEPLLGRSVISQFRVILD